MFMARKQKILLIMKIDNFEQEIKQIEFKKN